MGRGQRFNNNNDNINSYNPNSWHSLIPTLCQALFEATDFSVATVWGGFCWLSQSLAIIVTYPVFFEVMKPHLKVEETGLTGLSKVFHLLSFEILLHTFTLFSVNQLIWKTIDISQECVNPWFRDPLGLAGRGQLALPPALWEPCQQCFLGRSHFATWVWSWGKM